MADEKRTGVDWQDLRVFLALGRYGSLSAAARALGVNHATVARRLKALEDALGERLVERRPEGFVLTPAGVHAMTVAGDMEIASSALGRADPGGAPSGLVRVNAPPALTQGYLLARLAAIYRTHPGVDIDIATDTRSISLDRHEADIAVRIDRPADGDVIATPVATLAYGFYGTAEACARLSAGGPLALIGFDEASAHLPEAVWMSKRFPRARRPFRAGSQYAQALAARSGVGLALLPHYIGRSEPTLAPCDLGATPPARDVFLIRRRHNARTRPIVAVVDYLVGVFRQDRALFDGPGVETP